MMKRQIVRIWSWVIATAQDMCKFLNALMSHFRHSCEEITIAMGLTLTLQATDLRLLRLLRRYTLGDVRLRKRRA